MEQLLLALDVQHWETRQTVAFDWYDGPRQGLCALAVPECEFVFDLVDERCNPDGVDDRLFRLREIPKGTVARVLSLIASLGTPSEQASAEAAIDEILAASRPTPIVIRTDVMKTFLGCWEIPEMPPEGECLFTFLGI